MARLVRQPCGSLQVLEVPPLSKSSSVGALMMASTEGFLPKSLSCSRRFWRSFEGLLIQRFLEAAFSSFSSAFQIVQGESCFFLCVWNQSSNFRYAHLVLLIGATDSSEHPHVDMRHILTKNHPQRGATLAQMLGTGQ